MGVAVALVGVAVLLIAFGVSSQTTGSIVEGVGSPAILANDNYTHVIPVSPQRSANVEYAWSASKSVRVFLYQAAGCANNTPGYVCPGPELKSWWTDTGIYTYTGSVSEPFLLIVQNVNSTTVLYNGTLVESYPAMSSLGSGWELFVILVGSVILIGFGAIAVFLGVFLRGGVYGPPPQPIGQPDSALLGRGSDDLDDDGWDDAPPGHDPDDEDDDDV